MEWWHNGGGPTAITSSYGTPLSPHHGTTTRKRRTHSCRNLPYVLDDQK